MTGMVVDSSVTMAWFFEDETTPFTETILNRTAIDATWVPALWVLECANVLVTAQRRGRLDTQRKKLLIERAMGLPLLIDRDSVRLAKIERIADQYGLTAYDAAYLELAMRRSLTLITLDAKLASAARAADHPVETELSL